MAFRSSLVVVWCIEHCCQDGKEADEDRTGRVTFSNLAHIVCFIIGLMLNRATRTREPVKHHAALPNSIRAIIIGSSGSGDAHSPLVIHKLALTSPSKNADDARSDVQVRYGPGQHFHQRDAIDESSNFPIYSTTESNLGPDEEGERDIILLGNIAIKEDRTKRKVFRESSKRGWEDFIRCSCCRSNLLSFCCSSCPTSMVYRRMVRADPPNPAKSKVCQCCEFGNQMCCKLCDLLK